VNGYSGFVPRGYTAIAEALRGFPDDQSRARLAALGVTHVVVHVDAYGGQAPALVAALGATQWLTLIASDDSIRVYRVTSS
jgi:hypothetical protein